MKDVNTVAITGRLTRDAQLKYTTSGFAICEVSVAVNRSVKKGDSWEEEPSFFDCTMIGKRAEALSNKLTKGSAVTIQGQLRQDRWKSQEGHSRSKVVIMIDEIRIERSTTQHTQQSAPVSFQQEPAPEPQWEDDVPF